MSSRIAGLSEIAPRYKAILCDVWGVIHNGVVHNREAVEALAKFRADHGPVILITNAPRPSAPIVEQLENLAVPRDCFNGIVTSGDVTRDAITATGKRKLLHIGPDRDLPLYEGLDIELVAEEEAEVICCTGLVDDATENADDYDTQLLRLARRHLPFICANPDKVVEKGGKIIYCAGALADRFEAYGGEVLLVGKPEAPIYEAAIAALEKAAGKTLEKSEILIIGDSLPTDIRGAHYQHIPALFITAGIHAADFGEQDNPDDTRVNHRLDHEDCETVGYLTRLSW